MKLKVFAVSFFCLFLMTLLSCSAVKGYFFDDKISQDIKMLEKDTEEYIEKPAIAPVAGPVKSQPEVKVK